MHHCHDCYHSYFLVIFSSSYLLRIIVIFSSPPMSSHVLPFFYHFLFLSAFSSAFSVFWGAAAAHGRRADGAPGLGCGEVRRERCRARRAQCRQCRLRWEPEGGQWAKMSITLFSLLIDLNWPRSPWHVTICDNMYNTCSVDATWYKCTGVSALNVKLWPCTSGCFRLQEQRLQGRNLPRVWLW